MPGSVIAIATTAGALADRRVVPSIAAPWFASSPVIAATRASSSSLEITVTVNAWLRRDKGLHTIAPLSRQELGGVSPSSLTPGRKWPSRARFGLARRLLISGSMIRLSLSVAALATLVACTDALPYMEIYEGSTTGNTTNVVVPGTATFPQTVMLRIEGRRVEGGYDVNDPLARAELALVEGSACRITVPLSCMGGICFAELELTGAGLCQVRATGVTRDGIAIDQCWYRGTWEHDPADAAFALEVQEAAEAAHASCLDSAP
jgi:hypothetical protein